MNWSMDILGPMPATPGGLRFLLILTDYFLKWVEAGAFVLIKDIDVECLYLAKYNLSARDTSRNRGRQWLTIHIQKTKKVLLQQQC